MADVAPGERPGFPFIFGRFCPYPGLLEPAAGERTRMNIHVEQIEESPQCFSFEGSPQWWEARAGLAKEMAYTVESPFAFELEARKMGSDLVFKGSLRGAIEVECSRCLVRYREGVSDGFRLVLEQCGDRVPADPESAESLSRDGVWLGDDLELGSYQGSELNLESYLAEVISLALPVQPLCGPDCEGLCAHCGADLNRVGCDCADETVKSPFAALATLLEEKK